MTEQDLGAYFYANLLDPKGDTGNQLTFRPITSFAEQPLRALAYPDRFSWTDHVEITNTLYCYLIAASKACSGCTAVNPQGVNETMVVLGEDRQPRVDIQRVIQAHEILKAMGVNFITDMGGENLTLPGYEEVVSSIGRDPILDGLIYSSSIYFLGPDDRPNRKFGIYEAAGLWDGAMFFLSSVDRLVESRAGIPSGDPDATYLKAYSGLKLMEWLVSHGHNRARTLGIHMVIRQDNIDQIIPLYQRAEELGVWFSFCDLVHAPYTSRRANPAPAEFYKRRLREVDIPRLEETLGWIIAEESRRLKAREGRSIIPSSAFTRMSITYGPDNQLSCRAHRQERLPNTFDVHPTGQVRACIAQNTVEDVGHCAGCAYISLDRGQSDYVPFEVALFGARLGDIVWRNALVNRKHPAFRPDRENLALQVAPDGSVGPLYPDVKYYDRASSSQRTVRDRRELLIDEAYYGTDGLGNIFPLEGVLFIPEWF